MNKSKCHGHHEDKKKTSWKDTGGDTWTEYECNGCGRLKRIRG